MGSKKAKPPVKIGGISLTCTMDIPCAILIGLLETIEMTGAEHKLTLAYLECLQFESRTSRAFSEIFNLIAEARNTLYREEATEPNLQNGGQGG